MEKDIGSSLGDGMKVLKQLFCKHDYEQEYLHMIDMGMDKIYKLTYKKCGKEMFVRGGRIHKYLRG